MKTNLTPTVPRRSKNLIKAIGGERVIALDPTIAGDYRCAIAALERLGRQRCARSVR